MNKELAKRAAKQLREMMFDGELPDECVGCHYFRPRHNESADDAKHESHCEYIKLVVELESVSI